MVKALVVEEQNGPLRVEDITLKPVGPGEVRIRVAAAGVCHSDLSMVNGTILPRYPLVLGHEAAGVVEEVGEGVRGLSVGTHVVINWAAPCRRCWFCLHGEPWLCSVNEGATGVPRGSSWGERELYACMGIGSLAEQVVLPESSAVAIPPEVPLDVAALLGCAVLTGIGAVANAARVRAGESVMIMGMGGVGLSAILGARRAGAETIIAVDRSDAKRAVALRLGATEFLVSHPRLSRDVRERTEGRGVDHSLDCVGLADTIRLCWGSARRGGSCTIVGIGGANERIEFSPMQLFHFGRVLNSSLYGNADAEREIPVLASEVASGELRLDALISDRIELAGVPDAFDRMAKGVGARSLVTFHE